MLPGDFEQPADAVHVFGGQFKISPERVTQQLAEVRNCKWCALLRRPDVIRFAAQVAMRCVDSAHSSNIGTHTMLMPESSYA